MVVSILVHVQNGETKILTMEDTEKEGAVVTGIKNPAINLQEGKELT